MKKPLGERSMAVLWPSFLMAGVLEMLVFSLVDPTLLRLPGGVALDWSPTAVYTVAFFVFWLVIAIAGALTELLDAPSGAVNQRPFSR
jgi:hypothetical protein